MKNIIWKRHELDMGIKHKATNSNKQTLAEILTSDFSGKRVVIVYAYDENGKMLVKRHTYGRENDAIETLKQEIEKELNNL